MTFGLAGPGAAAVLAVATAPAGARRALADRADDREGRKAEDDRDHDD